MRQTLEQVKSYACELRQHRDLMQGIYQEAFDYCRPNENAWGTKTEGGDKDVEVYDDTAIECVPKFAARYQEAMIPADQDWFLYELPESAKSKILAENGDIAGQDLIDQLEIIYQEQSDIFFDYIHRSNLNIEADTAFMDLAVGVMAMWIPETDDQEMPFRFSQIPLHQLLIGEGINGEPCDIGQETEEQVQNVVGKWGNMGSIHPNVMKMYQENKLTEKVKVVQISIKDRVTGEYHWHVIDMDNDHEMYKGTFSTSPGVALRYRRCPGEVFGRGPCITKLPTIRVLNTREELILRSEHRTVGGIFLANDDGVFDPYNTSIVPETVIPVSDVDKSIKELPYQGRIDIVEARTARQQAEIKKAFFANEFNNTQDPVRSATEISIAYQEMIRDMGGSISRIKREFLDQIVLRVTDVLVRRGIMSEMAKNRELTSFRYTSPIARAQDAKDLESLTQAINTTNSLLGPEITMQEYSPSRVAREIGDKFGIDKRLQTTKEEKEQQAKAMQQQMNMQQQQ